MYPKPAGYQTSALAIGSQSYKPFNGYRQGFGPVQITSEVFTLTFSAAPDDGSGFNIDFPTIAFAYAYGGSPGAGVIPLVMGGGTAAQAATATQVALAAQIGDDWEVTNPSSGVVVMSPRQKGRVVTFDIDLDPNFTVETDLPTFSNVIPGKFGKNYCFMPDDSILTNIGEEQG